MTPVRTTVLSLVAALAVAVPPAAAFAQEPSAPAPRVALDAPTERTGDARATLRAVEAAFAPAPARARRAAGGESRDLTLLLRDLRQGLDELSDGERARAERYLGRPDGNEAFPDEPLYSDGVEVRNDCTVAPTPGSKVCVHWATSTRDAPPPDDSDSDGLPDQVETTRDVLNEVWASTVDAGGYRAPRSDASSANRGPDTKLDVYLADLGASRLYGYCSTDDPAMMANAAVSAFCALDDDFATTQFTGVPLENLQVTAAHEFFHAVQYAYDWFEDGWLLEGTAAWIEDELYDDVDDNLQYLSMSPLSSPDMPMDYIGSDYSPYGSWIFWRYLAERFPGEQGTGMPVVIRDVIGRTGGSDVTDEGEYSTQALTRALAARDVALPTLFSQFGTTNRRPAAFYEEGSSYRGAPTALSLRLKNSKAKSVTTRPYHLSNDTIKVVPAAALKGRRWKLRVNVNMPKRAFGYAAAVTTVSKAGRVSTKQVRLAADGDGKLVTSFGRVKVRSVEVTLTNASVRYHCWLSADSPFACYGQSKDDRRAVKATVKAYR
jgi:hypothetical protein